MAVLGSKKTFVVGFYLYGILEKRLALSIRNVSKSDIDVRTKPTVFPYMLRIHSIKNTIEAKKCFVTFSVN